MNKPPSDLSFERVADLFAAEIREGKQPAIDRFVNEYSQHAEAIRRLFPVLEMMERRGHPVQDLSESGLLAAEMESLKAIPLKRQFGDFEILREVGRGGMGVVFEARQQSLERRVALKLLPESARLDERRKQRFLQEAQTSGKLHHTNIVPVFGIGEHEDTSYMVMQFIDGRSLDCVIDELSRVRSGETAIRNQTTDGAEAKQSTIVDLLKESRGEISLSKEPSQSPPPPNEAQKIESAFDLDAARSQTYWVHVAKIGFQVSDALTHAHAHNILHRDIKPSNLLIDDSQRVWVTDFGLAKFFESPELTKSGEVVGTLRYMSPEQLAGRADERSDIFALGLTLFELALLRPAYESKEHGVLMRDVLEGNIQPIRSIDHRVPIDLATIIEKCLALDPADRYESAERVTSDLDHFIRGEPVSVRPIGSLRRAWKWCRRRPLIAGLIASLIISILIGFTGIAWQWQKTSSALLESEANLKEANIQTAAAQEHFQQARETVNRFFTVVSQQRLLREPGLQQLRQELLSEAAEYHKEFVNRYRDDDQLQFELAVSLFHIVEIEGSLSADPKILDAIDEPISILEKLAKANPQDHDYKYWKSRCFMLKSKLLRRIDAISSMDTLQDSVKLLEELHKQTPDSWRESNELATQYQMLGLAHESMERATGDTESSTKYYTKSMVLRTELRAKHPDDVSNLIALASLYRDLGISARRQAKNDQAVKNYDLAMNLLQSIVEKHPEDDEARRMLGAVANSVGYFYGQGSDDKSYSNALKYYGISKIHFQLLCERNPMVFEFRDALARAMVGESTVLQVQGKLEESLAGRIQAAEIRQKIVDKNPSASNLRSSWAISLNGVGATLRSLDRIEESIEYHEKAHQQHTLAVSSDPQQPVLRMRLIDGLVQFSRAYSAARDFSRAVASLDDIDEYVTPRFSRAQFLKGRELVMVACRWQDAKEEAEEKEMDFRPEFSQEEILEKAKTAFRKAAKLKFDVAVWSKRDASIEFHKKYSCCTKILEWIETEFGKRE